MSSLALLLHLAAFLEPFGLTGAAVAIVSSVAAATAILVRSAGITGGAIAGWLVASIMSLAYAATGGWMPTLVSVAALPLLATAAGLFRTLRELSPSTHTATERGHQLQQVQPRIHQKRSET